jgi:hypothetical protein
MVQKHTIEGCKLHGKIHEEFICPYATGKYLSLLCELIAVKVETTDDMTVHQNQMNTSGYASEFALQLTY